jgi:hypothetical protein
MASKSPEYLKALEGRRKLYLRLLNKEFPKITPQRIPGLNETPKNRHMLWNLIVAYVKHRLDLDVRRYIKTRPGSAEEELIVVSTLLSLRPELKKSVDGIDRRNPIPPN